MRVIFRSLLSASALVLAPSLAAAQDPVTLSGRVTTEAGQPIGYAEVIIPSLGLGSTTRDDGRYAIVIPGARATAGQTISLTARRLGYKPVTAQLTLSGAVVEHDFTLSAESLAAG